MVAPMPPATPDVPLEPWERAGPSAGVTVPAKPEEAAAEPAPELAKSAPKPEKAGAAPSTKSRPRGTLPGGAECLAELAATDVRFSKSEPVLGIATPVVIEGPIGGITYFTHEKKPMVTDCRLALALFEISPELKALGVERVRYSSTYVYRTSHPGRMSMHAYGLAIDVHALTIAGTTFDVKQDFVRGQGATCTNGMKPLNLVSCRLRGLGLFKELIGPDDNAAHRDHFHLGLKPLAGEVAADLPWPKPPPRVKARSRSGRARSAR
jgi:hypothetical protein